MSAGLRLAAAALSAANGVGGGGGGGVVEALARSGGGERMSAEEMVTAFKRIWEGDRGAEEHALRLALADGPCTDDERAEVKFAGTGEESSLRLANNREFSERAGVTYPGLGKVWACACLLVMEGTGRDTMYRGLLDAYRQGARTDKEVRAHMSDVLGTAGRAAGESEAEIFVDSGRCGGYMPDTGFDLDELAESWFFGEAAFPSSSEGPVLDALGEILAETIGPAVDGEKTWGQWLSQPSNYGTSGASHWADVRLDDGSRLRNKWSIPISSSTEEISARVEAERGKVVPLQLIKKREAEKIRGVVGDSDTRYLVGRYLLGVIEGRLLTRGGVLSMFWSRPTTVTHYSEVMRLLALGAVALPIDIKKFDRSFSNALLFSAQRAVLRALGWDGTRQRLGADAGLAAACSWYSETMRSSYSGRETDKGLPSGLAWTMLLGSLINAAIARAAAKLAGVTPALAAHQGDDAELLLWNEREAAKVLGAYILLQVPMNATKNFVSRGPKRKSEYLRFVSRPNRTYGYLSRAIISVLARNPLNVDQPATEVSDIMGRWGTLLARGLREEFVHHWMSAELRSRTGLSEGQVALAGATPLAAGGLGWAQVRLEHGDGLKLVRDAGGAERRWVKAVGARTAWAEAFRVVSVSAGVGLDAAKATANLVPPTGGRPEMSASATYWTAHGRGLSANAVAFHPTPKRAFDPMAVTEAVEAARKADVEPRTLQQLFEDTPAWRLCALLPRSVAYSWLTGELTTPVASVSILSDAVVSMLKKTVDARLVNSIVHSSNPNSAMVRRVRLAAELELRAQMRKWSAMNTPQLR